MKTADMLLALTASAATIRRDGFAPMSVAHTVVNRPQVKDIQLLAKSQAAPLSSPSSALKPSQSNVNLLRTSQLGVQPESHNTATASHQIQDPAILSVILFLPYK